MRRIYDRSKGVTNCSEVTRRREARSSSRTNLYLGAVLRGPAFSVPVTVRNLSSTGALLETASAPEEGTLVQLTRAQLSVSAVVVWTTDGRCGLRFRGRVIVKEWLPPNANREQARVDATIQGLKNGGIEPQPNDLPVAVPDRRILARDLRAVVALLQSLENVLSDDENLLLRFPTELQSLDVAVQMLDEISGVLAGELSISSADKLASLRLSMSARD